jgi:hypothetical protein
VKRSCFLVIGIVALSPLGYACSSGPPNNIPLPCGTEVSVELAKEYLARRKGTDKGEIAVVAVEAVDWPDTRLGCPEPDMMYAQVITPGYRILLSYAGEIYEYHSDQGDRVVYCERW